MKLNCDLGEYESYDPNSPDEKIMPYIDMANIACGRHAGSVAMMKKTVALAIKYDVDIGAHPSYDDKVNFGRVSNPIDSHDLVQLIREQIAELNDICQQQNTTLDYVKPHGALYNDMMVDLDVFQSVCQAIETYNPNLHLLIQAIPELSTHQQIAKEHNIQLHYEAFADRNYLANGLLVPRRFDNAVIHHTQDVVARCKRLINHNTLQAVDGTLITMKADSICVHGDNEEALEMVIALKQQLKG